MTTKLGCTISTEDKALLKRLTKETGKTQTQLIAHLLHNYKKINSSNSSLSLDNFNLSESEQTEVKKALANSKTQLEEIAKEGLLQRSRYLNSIADKQARLELMSEEEISKATFKGAANFKIEQAIQTIMNHNNSQAEKSRKLCLTRGIIFKLTGSNRQTINKYFENHDEMISTHNGKHELTDTDNRKGKGFSFHELLGV